MSKKMPTLPPELHHIILESASPTQHPTLRLVSHFFKSKVDSLKASLYLPAPFITEPYEDWCTKLTPPNPTDAPFLIHSAVFNCTGYFHRTLDSKSKKIVLSATKRPRKQYDVPEELLQITQEFITHRNDQLIIPNTDTPLPLERTIRLQYLMNRNCGASAGYEILVLKGDKIGEERGMTVGEFAEFIAKFRAKKTLLKVPSAEVYAQAKRFVVKVGVESERGILTVLVEDLNSYYRSYYETNSYY
ncbi:hypothetical protein TWF481_007646 [Arthrobotrys musiformis]|uniref:F-box domain-containing protein n=1 Tax=Arthrobotrys musiformis TaxID=47236 RepID=A0AAV9WEC6_9PEZI